MIPIFIGTEPAQWLPTEVLKFSILRRSKEHYEFTDLKDVPFDLNLKMYTGFSFYRFAIPELCKYEGRAIYLDADMVVLTDLKELFEMEMAEKPVLARPSPDKTFWFTSMMLMDCSCLKHWKVKEWATLINTGIADYDGIMFGDKEGLNHKDFAELPLYWNDMDNSSDKTKIIHYTDVPNQPWKKAGHPHAHVFLNELKDALKEGVIKEEDVQHEIDAGHVYPTLLEEIK